MQRQLIGQDRKFFCHYLGYESLETIAEWIVCQNLPNLLVAIALEKISEQSAILIQSDRLTQLYLNTKYIL